MKKMKIAILDNSDDLKYDETCKGEETDFFIINHGAICASIIENHLLDKQDIIIDAKKVLRRHELTGNFFRLRKAMVWCKKNDVKIINLSLGSKNPRDFARIDDLCKKMSTEGEEMIIVASLSNDKCFTLPACSEYAIGVGIDDSFRGSYYWSKDYNCVFLSGAQTFSIERSNGERIAIPAYSSFATPYIVAEIANYLNIYPDASLKKIKEQLKHNSQHSLNRLENHKRKGPIIFVRDNIQVASEIVKYYMGKGYYVLVSTDESTAESFFIQKRPSFPYDMEVIVGEECINDRDIIPDIIVESHQVTVRNNDCFSRKNYVNKSLFRCLDRLLIEE